MAVELPELKATAEVKQPGNDRRAPAAKEVKPLFSTEPVKTAEAEFSGYRALNSAAVLSLVLGVLSALAMLDWWLAVLPAAGSLLGIHARRKIARHPEEFTGKGLATAGLLLSVVFFIAGWSRLGYVHATEVPDGHLRISYEELQPDEKVLGQQIPPSAMELNGKRVFIKGYVFPGENGWHYPVPAGPRQGRLLLRRQPQADRSHPSDVARPAGNHVLAAALKSRRALPR